MKVYLMIKIQNLDFSYNGTDPALTNINLHIEKGKWISILGHNGSGKSTLAKLIGRTSRHQLKVKYISII
jgi:energy-coupling factor transport system ATP-binding protein